LTLVVTPVAYSMFAEMEERKVFAGARQRLSRGIDTTRFFTFLIR
jgi:hypothetical protein